MSMNQYVLLMYLINYTKLRGDLPAHTKTTATTTTIASRPWGVTVW